MHDVERRMLREAIGRLRDADLLSQSATKSSDSDAFLQVLAFEVLLKCCIRLHTGRAVGSHDYVKLWSLLPVPVASQVAQFAEERFAGLVSLVDIDQYLKDWRFVFEKARYGYEINAHLTDEEVREKGKAWVDAGAEIDVADIRYRPLELQGLIEGLIANVESQISN